MHINSQQLLFFSPTGTTKRILKSISEGINLPLKNEINLTKSSALDTEFDTNTMALIGIPVYSGRVPLKAVERIKKLKADKTPAVCIAVYGNRAYEDALIELQDIVEELGFITICGGAFIGEHSYSTDTYKIADKRPDKLDLDKAKQFGEMISKYISDRDFKEIDSLKLPGNFPYKERKEFPKLSPVVDKTLCTKCGTCLKVCPVSAIQLNEHIEFDSDKCILCCACSKSCPQDALTFDDPWIKSVSERLAVACKNRKEPEFFMSI